MPELAVDAIKNVSSEASKRSVYHFLFQTAEFKNIAIFPHLHSSSYLFFFFLGKKDKKKKVPEKKEAHHSFKAQCPEVSLKSTPAPSKDDPSVKKSDTPPPVQDEDKQKQLSPSPASRNSSPDNDPPLLPSPEDPRPPLAFPSSAYKKDRKLSSPLSRSPHATASNQPPEPCQEIMQQQTQTPAKKEGPTKSPSNEPRKKPSQHSQPSSAASSGRNC